MSTYMKYSIKIELAKAKLLLYIYDKKYTVQNDDGWVLVTKGIDVIINYNTQIADLLIDEQLITFNTETNQYEPTDTYYTANI